MTNCHSITLTYDISSTAGLYSTLTGVLAGFAFIAITLVLSGAYRRPHDEFEDDAACDRRVDAEVHLSLALIVAFLGLVIATILYAILAGERDCALVLGRAASEELLAGVAFAFAALLLLYALVYFVVESGAPRIGSHVRGLVAVVGPPLAVLFLALGGLDIAYTPWSPGGGNGLALPHPGAFTDQMGAAALALPVGTFAICAAGFVLKAVRRGTSKPTGNTGATGRDPLGEEAGSIWEATSVGLLLKPPETPPEVPKARWWRHIRIRTTALPYVLLALIIGAAVHSVTFSVKDSAARMQEWQVWMWLLVCAAVLIAQSLVLSFGRDDEP